MRVSYWEVKLYAAIANCWRFSRLGLDFVFKASITSEYWFGLVSTVT